MYFGFAIAFCFTLSFSFLVGNDLSALLQMSPVSTFKVPGIFFEPLEFSCRHSGGFTAQDTLLTNRDTSVLGFWDIGRVCGRNRQSDSLKKDERHIHLWCITCGTNGFLMTPYLHSNITIYFKKKILLEDIAFTPVSSLGLQTNSKLTIFPIS